MDDFDEFSSNCFVGRGYNTRKVLIENARRDTYKVSAIYLSNNAQNDL